MSADMLIEPCTTYEARELAASEKSSGADTIATYKKLYKSVIIAGFNSTRLSIEFVL